MSSFSQAKSTRPSFTANRSTLGTSLLSTTLDGAATLTNLSALPRHLRPSALPAPPVAVAEVVSLADHLSDVSVGIGPSSSGGWAWLVHNRSLLIWRLGNLGSSRGLSCRELTLPVSGLAHNASLVNVFGEAGNRAPSCLAVSPEGQVRFWPSVAHAANCQELVLDLQGEECTELINVQPLGCILATTTSTIGLISIPDNNQHGNLGFRVLKGEQGVLGGLGKRMSSLLWGANGANHEMKLVSLTSLQSGSAHIVFVLTDSTLQRWIVESQMEKLVYNIDIAAMAKEAFANTVMLSEVSSASWVKVTPLDAQISGNQLLLLLAATNQKNKDGGIYFAFAALSSQRERVAMEFDYFWPLYSSEERDQLQEVVQRDGLESLRLLVPRNSVVAFICSPSCIISFRYKEEGNALLDTLELGKDDLLGLACDKERALAPPHFFSATHSLFIIEQPSVESEDKGQSHDYSLNQTVTNLAKLSDTLNLSHVDARDIEKLGGSDNAENKLKAAFLLFCKQNMSECKRLVAELLPYKSGDDSDDSMIDSDLDDLVVEMSRDLIDDFPASDPRWLETVPDSSMIAKSLSYSASTSTLIQHQLEDKQKALEVFFAFLQEVGIWNKLRRVRIDDYVVNTGFALRSHAEKTAAAIALRSLHNEHQALVDEAIAQCLSHRQENTNGSDEEDGATLTRSRFLTPQDYFYRKISVIDEIIEGLHMSQQQTVKSAKDSQQIIAVVLQVNAILIRMVREAQSTVASLNSDCGQRGDSNLVSWTTSLGLRTRLIDQFKVTLRSALDLIEDAATKNRAQSQLIDLGDLVLAGLNEQLSQKAGKSSEKEVKQEYESTRYELVMALVDKKLMEAAGVLGEKYLEFNGLVTLCDRLKDESRLKHYLSLYSAQGMAEVLFEWHIRHGKKGKLLSNFGQDKKLTGFLNNHSSISWLQDIGEDKLDMAANTLLQLASKEQKRLAKRKVLLSLSKLSWLASDSEEMEAQIDSIDNELYLIGLQEQIPMELLRSQMDDKNLNGSNVRVLKPRELLELLICESNKKADVIEFQKALELLQFINEEDVDLADLKTHIWSMAVLKDDWISFDVDNVLQLSKPTLFVRLAENCIELSENSDVLPPMEELLASDDLQHLSGSSKFQFLLKSAYESLARGMSRMDVN